MTISKDTGDYLGCEIWYDKEKMKCWVGQPSIMKKLERTFGELVADQPVYGVPGTPNHTMLGNVNSNKIRSERHSLYQTGVRMLLYLVKYSRPNLANAARELSKSIQGPTEASWKELLRGSSLHWIPKTMG